QHEASIVAQGMAKAASLLAGQYSWVITNVPYLSRSKQSDILKNFCEKNYPEGKNDLATVFLDRCLELCEQGGTSSIVLPQNWLFLTSYKKFRENLLINSKWNLIASLGSGAFETISGEVVKGLLLSISKKKVLSDLSVTEKKSHHFINGLDVSDAKTVKNKDIGLCNDFIKSIKQSKQRDNPDARITLEEAEDFPLFDKVAYPYKGITTGDDPKYRRCYWEFYGLPEGFLWFQSTVKEHVDFGGLESVVWFSGMTKPLQSGVYIRAKDAWGKSGVLISLMGKLSAARYLGHAFDTNISAIVPYKDDDLQLVWSYLKSEKYNQSVRKIDKKINVTNATLGKVPFDESTWRDITQVEFPHNLPAPYTNDPTQWIFHGHPCGSVIWHEQDKKTVIGELRKDESVLQTALARLLGYQWPAETDDSSDKPMELAEEQRHWVKACEALKGLVDDDGIACIPAIRGEKPAADRLEAMLQASYGDAWNVNVLNELLTSVKASSLEAWLRDKFFDQHCKMFGHRPFIWQVWDGLKDGFSALVNYHQLDADNLDRLIYTYLGDWIRSQEQEVKDGIDGADIRLTAAQNLKIELEAIKQGEAASDGKAGYDIFVRWKPTHEQPMGWNPDLNDGVRLNIRPFMTAKDMGKKGAGILRGKPNVHWRKDRGTDVESAPWYTLGEQYGEKLGSRINDHHLTLAEKQVARDKQSAENSDKPTTFMGVTA
ncbi:MAG: N-6 DNA methylase, partial [Colwellia sp.]